MALYAPKALTKYGKELWRKKYDELDSRGVEFNEDVLQFLNLYVIASENVWKAYQEIAKKGIQSESKKGDVKNPALITLKDSQKQLRDAIDFFASVSGVEVTEDESISGYL